MHLIYAQQEGSQQTRTLGPKMILEQEKHIFGPINHMKVMQKLKLFKRKYSVFHKIILIGEYLEKWKNKENNKCHCL